MCLRNGTLLLLKVLSPIRQSFNLVERGCAQAAVSCKHQAQNVRDLATGALAERSTAMESFGEVDSSEMTRTYISLHALFTSQSFIPV
jgi:hypothetical protein